MRKQLVAGLAGLFTAGALVGCATVGNPVPVSPDTDLDPAAACTGRTSCTPVGIADIDGDGSPDAIAQIVDGDDREIIIRLAAGPVVGTDVPADLGVGYQSLVDQPIEVFDLNPDPGAEIVVPVDVSAGSVNFAVLTWRDGGLSFETPPGATLNARTGGFTLWSLTGGEGSQTRILCRPGGEIAVGVARLAYGGAPAGRSTITDYRFVLDRSGIGHAANYILDGSARTVSAEEILGGDEGTRFFRCESALARRADTADAVPPPTETTAPDTCTDTRPDLDSPVVREAIDEIPGPSRYADYGWLPNYTGDYNACATLSYALLDGGGTGSSPQQVLLFHRGEFLRAATDCNLPTAGIDSTGDSVTITYRWPRGRESNAESTGRATLTFSWSDDRLQQNGRLPAEALEIAGCA